MRRFAAAVLLSMLAAVPLAAQFEGVITMKFGDKNMSNGKYYISGSHAAFTMVVQGGSGQMNGKEMRGVIDFPTMKETLLMPMPMGGMAGMKMVIDLNKASSDSTKKTYTMRALGTSQTIAGLTCDDYEIAENGKPTQRACMSKATGRFAMSMMGGNTRSSTWMRVLGQHPDLFPLKVTDPDGKLFMEVTSIQKGGVPSDIFTIPDGYMEMPSFGRSGGGE